MGAPEDRDAAFVAKITANATHEFRNVLAIIKESAGLATDVLQAQGGRPLSNPDRLTRAIGRIDVQVSRGVVLLDNLNRFAHCLDRAQDEIDLNREAEQTAFLCQRLARRGRHEIRVQAADRAVPLGANPLWLQMALYTAVECCFDQLPEGGEVTIRTGLQGDRPSLELVAEAGNEVAPPFATGAALWDQLRELLDRLGASVETFDTERRLVITLPPAGVA
jgi:signal transduction histidine kinase